MGVQVPRRCHPRLGEAEEAALLGGAINPLLLSLDCSEGTEGPGAPQNVSTKESSVGTSPVGWQICWGLFKYPLSEGRPGLSTASCRLTAAACSPAAGLETVPGIEQ